MGSGTDRAALVALVGRWNTEADEADADGDVCCGQTRRHDAKELEAALRAEAARPEPDVERLAEHLIAIYGCAVSQGGRLVKQGAHPGERVSQQFVEAIRDALHSGDTGRSGDRGGREA